MGSNKLVIAQDGYDAEDSPLERMVFHSDYDTLKLKVSGSGSQLVSAATSPSGPSGVAVVTIPHKLSKPPVVMVFCTSIWRSNDKFSPYAFKSIGAISPDGGAYSVDSTNLYIHLFNGDTTGDRTIHYKYHIYYNELV